MPRVKPVLLTVLALLPLGSRAEPESEVRNAVSALAGTSYAWETTVRQRFSSESNEPRLDPRAPVELRGRVDPNGYTEIALAPSRELAAPVAAVLREGDVVGHTPLGWLRRTKMRQVSDPNRVVDFEGKRVRLSEALNVALRVTAQRNLTEELVDLIDGLKSYRSMEGLVIAELRDAAIERMWGDARAKRAPEIHGTVIFKISDGALTEYHVVLGIGFPNSRTKKVAWSMMQWSTRITGIGTTTVEPPAAAIRALQTD
jgi:hypothetical protein